jgi:hypothetical protein
MKTGIRTLLLFVMMSVVFRAASAQFAQRGGVGGTVFDPSGAVIPGAEILLTDTAQKQTIHVKADAAGHYEFNDLVAGVYQLSATFPGFATQKSQALTVNLGGVTRFDFRLRTGSVEQVETVTDEAGGLETDKASLDTNVTSQQFQELPLNGRNFTSIAALAPGVSTYPQSNVNGGTYSVGAQFASGGVQFTTGGSFQGSRDNGFYVNGVNIDDNYESSISYEPSPEALGNGTIQVADFSAAVGHDISAITMQTKGGASKFHGEAFDFIENDALNAVNPFTHANNVILGLPYTKPKLRRNQFGGNLSGPVYLPKILPGLRDKLFFFANYEDFIEHDGGQVVTGSVPSVAERTGDFSELLNGDNSQNPIQLYNPYYTTYVDGTSSRPAIAGNRVDLAMRPDGSPLVDPRSAAILAALYPLPNIAGNPSNEVNYAAYQAPGISNYHIDTRFDAHLTQRDSIFVTYSTQNGKQTLSGGIQPEALYNFPVSDHSFLVTTNYAHVFTERLTNEFLFGTSDGALTTISPGSRSYLNGSDNPLNTLFQNTGDGFNKGIFAVYAGNYVAPGLGEGFRAENESFQFSDNVDLTLGRHTLTAGLNYFRKSEIDWDIARNVYFGGFSSSGGDLNYAGGDGVADLVMGVPNTLKMRYKINGGGPQAPVYNIVFPSWGMYVNDRFRLSPKLTVSMGLRYELSIPNYTPDPKAAPCCAIYEATGDGGILEYPGIAPGLSNHYLSAPKLDFAPRVSVAYSLTPKTVIRAGYGIFYDTGSTQVSTAVGTAIYGTSSAVNYEINTTTLGTPVDTPALTLASIFPVPLETTLGSFPVPTGTGQGYDGDGQFAGITYYDQKSMPLPYYQRMILDVQRQVASHDVVTVSYAGVQGRKGTNEQNINLPAYQTGWSSGGGGDDPAYNAARPNNAGRFGDIYVIRPNLNSFYNAFILQYRHDFSKGFQVTSNYSYGKTVSDYPYTNTLQANGSGGAGVGGLQYANLYNRGETNGSHRQRFVYSFIWSPTYGDTWSVWLKEPFAGWRLTGIGTLESGDALTVRSGVGDACTTSENCATGYGTSARDGAGFDEVNVSGNPNLSHGKKTFDQQFNTAAFSMAPEDVRGNSGLGTVRGPGQNNVDLSIAKTFPLYERFHLELRLDAFNALNHTQWNGVNTQFPTGDAQHPFGQANSARDARVGQGSVKLVF